MDGTGVAPSSRTGRLPKLAKYEVIEEIGHGGMATVYRAHDRRLGRDVAIKVIHPHLRDSPEVAHRFSVEAQAVAKLRHANIVEVYDVSAEGEPEQYLVCELLRGVTLRKLLQRRGALPVEIGAAIAVELLDALAHAHAAGVVHRDVKPENVIIEHRIGNDADPARVVVKLTDFGIAKLLDAQGVTSTGQVLGSPAHMAPEQIEGGTVDARADVFGVGVLLYECLVGHLPFEGNNPAQVLRRVLEGEYPAAEHEQPSVGRAWSALLDRALAHKADDRFPDAAAMRDAILRELRRIGVQSPHAELVAWFDDPEGYAERHTTWLIGRLCELAAEARKRGDVLSAAADYNRALAYAPNDPQLLKVVASMHRAEARGRLLRHAARALFAAFVLGAVAFVVTQALRKNIVADGAPLATVSAIESPPPAPSATAPPTVSASPSASASVAPAQSRAPTVPTPTPPKGPTIAQRPTSREISFTTSPPYVRVSIDGAPPKDFTSGASLTLDDRPHKLRFTCSDPEQTMCDPSDVNVPAGTERLSMHVSLHIRDATLVVRGDGRSTYRVISKSVATIVASGVPARIPMKGGGKETAQVIELPSGRQATVILIAGREVTVEMPPLQEHERAE